VHILSHVSKPSSISTTKKAVPRKRWHMAMKLLLWFVFLSVHFIPTPRYPRNMLSVESFVTCFYHREIIVVCILKRGILFWNSIGFKDVKLAIRGCIQKFPDWLPGAKTANGTAATRCNCIAILWVRLVSFAAITLCVASQQVFVVVVVVYFFMTQSGNF
jgi:hypothetical protein